MSDFLKNFPTGRILLCDGAWGTMLQRHGLAAGECPELWNVKHQDRVLKIAAAYIEAGADILETNSFGGSRLKLAYYDLAKRAVELNERAAAISREAAGADKFVIGSVGPTGKILMMGDITVEEMTAAYTEQILALEKGGVDAICIETMMALDEAEAAIRAAKEHTSLPVICSFTFNRSADGSYHTIMGHTPGQTAEASIAAGADIIGTNCGNGIENILEIVRRLREAAPGVPILAQPNAGMPEPAENVDIYPQSPEEMSTHIPALIDAGADIIGGCCGTGPGHIREFAKIIQQRNQERSSS